MVHPTRENQVVQSDDQLSALLPREPPLRLMQKLISDILTRVTLDQFVLTPVMVGAFFTSQALLEGKGLGEAQHRLNTSWEPTLIKNWMVSASAEAGETC